MTDLEKITNTQMITAIITVVIIAFIFYKLTATPLSQIMAIIMILVLATIMA